MKTVLSLVVLTGFLMTLATFNGFCQSGNDEIDPSFVNAISIKIVYDNYLVNPALTSSWGFACIINMPSQTILFDTGGNSAVLISNMQKMGIDPQDIDLVLISHIHSDHLGGLLGFLEKNNQVTVYIPVSFPESIRKEISERGAKYQNIGDFIRISRDIYSTGQMGLSIKEQSLVIETQDGLIIVTGCAHPGITNIIQQAKQKLRGKKIFLVMGGFHLAGASDTKLIKIIKEFKNAGVIKVAPSHCSGDRCREWFNEYFQENYLNSGLGKIIKLGE